MTVASALAETVARLAIARRRVSRAFVGKGWSRRVQQDSVANVLKAHFQEDPYMGIG